MRHARKDYDRIQDPWRRIAADEPVFLIRAQDQVSGDAVRCWANLAAAAGADRHIVETALRHADAMDKWPKKRVPDMPQGEQTR